MYYKIGLDLGIASCGAAAVEVDEKGNAKKILSLHVRTFDKAEVPKTGASLAEARRIARGLRRRTRRKTLRLKEIRDLLEENDLSRKPNEKDVNELRIKALDESISKRDFARVLYSIAKHRGFKSNKKNASSKEDGKLLEATKKNDFIMEEKGYRTIGEMLIKEFSTKDLQGKTVFNTRNKDRDYSKAITRTKLIEEIKVLFECQRKFFNPFATKELEDKFLAIFARQRSFDEGPGKGSKYSASFAVGKCNGEYRAPKYSFTADYSIALQKINNLKIAYFGNERFLDENERKIIINLLLNKNEVKYKDIRKNLNLDNQIIFKGIDYKVSQKSKSKNDEELSFEEIVKKTEDKVFVSMKNSNSIAKCLCVENRIRDIIDKVAEILLFNKSEERINIAIKSDELLKSLSQEEIDNISALDCIKTSNLSLSMLKKIEPFLEQGKKYSEAMQLAGLSNEDNTSKSILLNSKEMREKIEEITSPVVKRSVSQAVKVINALIREYGSPIGVNIELAREMSKSFEERSKIDKENKQRQENNDKLRKELEEKLNRNIKSSDFIKYKLYEEQGGKCPYSGNAIDFDRLFSDEDYAQVDHILPYSKSFDDSFSNKVLVLTKENQDKKNNTAMLYQIQKGREKEYTSRVFAMYQNNPVKREKLLKEKIDETEWKNRALNDTSYLSRFVQNLLQDYLYFAPLKGIQRKVYAVKGQMTATLRHVWGIKKIREDGDLHHAVDACIIAVTNNSVIKNLSEYAKIKEQVKSGQGEYIDFSTGEVLGYKDVAALLKKGAKTPYEEFINELRIRCLPDIDNMHEELSKIGYSQEEIQKAKPIFVSRMPQRKAIGNMHKATYMSAKNIDKGFVTIKTALIDLKYNKNKDEIENYYNKDSDIKLYNLLLERLRAFDGDSKKAFSQPVYKPTKDGRQGPLVRSVKTIDTSISGMIISKTNSLVGNDSMIRLDVFKKEEKYYAIPIYVADLYRGKLPNKVALALKPEEQWPEVDDTYQFLFSLHKDDLVYIEHKKGIEMKKINKNVLSQMENILHINKKVLYYEGFDRSTCSISVSDSNNIYSKHGLGIATLLGFKKYNVDALGNINEVKSETRLPLKIKGD